MEASAKLIGWMVVAMVRWMHAEPMVVQERYEGIASDAVAVAYDTDEAPLFPGSQGRAKTAALILAIARLESDYSVKVDDGRIRGDHGSSFCMMQIHIGSRHVVLEGDTWRYGTKDEGWTGADLLADRRKCFRAGLHFARQSVRSCGNLSLYTSGRCSTTEATARERFALAKSIWPSVPVDDADVLAEGMEASAEWE